MKKMMITVTAVMAMMVMTGCRFEEKKDGVIEDKSDTRRIALSITRPHLYHIEIVFKEEKKEGSTM